MPLDAVVRASFQSEVRANQAVNHALVGHTQDAMGSGPFTREGTHLFRCQSADNAAVLSALAGFVAALQQYGAVVDHAFVYVSQS